MCLQGQHFINWIVINWSKVGLYKLVSFVVLAKASEIGRTHLWVCLWACFEKFLNYEDSHLSTWLGSGTLLEEAAHWWVCLGVFILLWFLLNIDFLCFPSAEMWLFCRAFLIGLINSSRTLNQNNLSLALFLLSCWSQWHKVIGTAW